MDAKRHSTQIDSVLLLDNGDVAVSGGPINYEVLVYRNRISAKQEGSTQYDIVDSVSTQGYSV